jgi:DNA primase
VMQRSALSYQEEECIRLLLNYGRRELEPGISLCRYVLEEMYNITFQTPPYDRMLARFRAAFTEGLVILADAFLYDDTDEEAQRMAIHLTTPRHELSDGWKKHEIFVPTEDRVETLSMLAFTNILRVKKILAEQQMHRLKKQIATVTDPNESDDLMRQYMHYKRAEMEFAKELGVVISG